MHSKKPVCIYYIKGNCRNGDVCDFFHPQLQEDKDEEMKDLSAEPSSKMQQKKKNKKILQDLGFSSETIKKAL